jgi:hypothetical protein
MNVARYLVGFLGRGINLSQGRYLYPGQHKYRINADVISVPRMGSEHAIPVLGRTRTARTVPRRSFMKHKCKTGWRTYVYKPSTNQTCEPLRNSSLSIDENRKSNWYAFITQYISWNSYLTSINWCHTLRKEGTVLHLLVANLSA